MRRLNAALCFQLQVAEGQVPEWIEIIPAPNASGLVVGRDGRTWRMKDAAAICSRFDLPIPIDTNHATELAAPKGGDSKAAGWIEELQARNGAVWGRVRWTEPGKELVRTMAYRFLSPVFDYEKASSEIFRLKNAALVNDPNFALALNSASHTTENSMLKEILIALGLKEDANATDAVTAINTLKSERDTARNSAEHPSLEKFVPRGDYDKALERATNAEKKVKEMDDKAAGEKVEALVQGGIKDGKVSPATADYYRAMCKREGGLEEFEKFLKQAPVIAPEGARGGRPEDRGTALNADQQKIAGAFGNSAEDLKKHAA
jgi:phage I-like protein